MYLFKPWYLTRLYGVTSQNTVIVTFTPWGMSNLIFTSFFTYIVCGFTVCLMFVQRNAWSRRFLWPRGLRPRSAAARLLRLWVRIPPETWMFVYCECCVLSGRGLCDELLTRPKESYRLWCVVVCDLETSWMRRPWPTGDCSAKNKQTNNTWPHGTSYNNDPTYIEPTTRSLEPFILPLSTHLIQFGNLTKCTASLLLHEPG